MTIDAFEQAAEHPVMGIGPYTIPHPYADGAITVSVIIDGVPVMLASTDYTVTPATSDSEGNVYLTVAAALAHDGRKLWIDRETPALQIWEARTGEREVGMEAQLDRLTMALQELQARAGGAVRVRGAMAPVVPSPGHVLVWGDGRVDAGPTVDEIAAAEGHAEAALAAQMQAQTAAATVPLHRAVFADLAALTPAQLAVGSRVVVFALSGTVFERVASGGDLDYSASGGVRLSVLASTNPIPVEAFSAVQAPTLGVYTDSAAALQKALNWSAAGIGRSVYFSGNYAIATTLVMPIAASVEAHRNAILRPLPGGGGPSIGIIAVSGSMLGWTCLPQLHQFSGYGISIRGTDLAHIYIPECHSCGCAIQLAATAADKNVLNTTIEFDAIANCGAVIEISSETSDCVIQGISIRGNFVTEATTFLRRVGVACSDDGPEINMIAIDFTHGGGAFCDNQIAGHAVPRPSVRISTWLGGIGLLDATPTQIFKGHWNGAQIDFCDAQIFDERHLTPDLVAASSWRIRAGLSLGGAVTLVPLGTALAGFNGGHMLFQTVFLAKLTLAAPLAAGATFGASFFHCLADGSYQHFDAMLQQGVTGVIVEAVHDQSATVSGRVAVVLRNVTAAAIPAGTTIYIAVRRD